MTAGDTFTRKNVLQVLDGLIYYLFNAYVLLTGLPAHMNLYVFYTKLFSIGPLSLWF